MSYDTRGAESAIDFELPPLPASSSAGPSVILAEVVPEHPAPRAIPRVRRRWLPLGLFLATCLSTFGAYGLMVAFNSASNLAALSVAAWQHAMFQGFLYGSAIMTILVCHEMGHFLQARRYGVYASYPYFIPMPLTPFGTMGAVIAMESRIGDRRSLFDIGISGPLAGLVPTLIFCTWGIYYSHFVPLLPHGVGEFELGEPLLYQYLVSWLHGGTPEGQTLLLHPWAFAGWVGLFLTSLNLIPIGQLDGGHVLYAMLKHRAHYVAWGLIGVAMVAIVSFRGTFAHWTPLLVLLLLVGPSHPPTSDDDAPLGIGRYLLGAATLGLIFLGFTLTPFNL